MRYACLFQFWFPRGVCPAVGLLGRMAVLFPVFSGISTLFSTVAVPVCIPTNSARVFPFLEGNLSLTCDLAFRMSHTDTSLLPVSLSESQLLHLSNGAHGNQVRLSEDSEHDICGSS